MSSESLAGEVEAVLMQLSVLLPSDKTVWDANQLLRLAVERLWIIAGNSAGEYRKSFDNESPVIGPWRELYEFRSMLAHATLGELNHDRVWRESVRDLPRLLEQVRAAW